MPALNRSAISVFVLVLFLGGLFAPAGRRGAAQNSDTIFGWLVSAPPLPQGAVRDATVRAGRDSVRLMRKRDGADLYARFSGSETQTASQKTWQQILNGLELTSAAPTGELVTGSLDAPVYYALCPLRNNKWQEAVAVTFDSGRADKIVRVALEMQSKPARQAETVRFGRHVCALIAKKDAARLFPLLVQPSHHKPSSEAELREYLTRSITHEEPIGKRIGEVVAPASVDDDNALMYVAEFAQGPRETRKIVLMFTPNHEKIAAFYLIPIITVAPQANANVP